MANAWQLTKPSWAEGILSALNLHAGQWAEILGVKIPPFSFTPGEWIEWVVDWLLIPINLLLRGFDELKGLVAQAWDAAAGALGKIDDWLTGAAFWFATTIAGWWSGVWDWLQPYIYTIFSSLKDWAGSVVSWFANIDDWIKSFWIDIRLYVRGITSELVSLDFFGAAWALIKPAVDGWAQFGGAVLDLMQYPIDWFTPAVLEPILGQFAEGFAQDMEQSNQGGGKT